MNKTSLLWLLLLCSSMTLKAQEDNLSLNVETLAGYISEDYVPFWLRANQYGSIPETGASLSLIGSLHKEYNSHETGIFDWGVGVEGRFNVGHELNFILLEGYGKIRVSIFELKAGRLKEVMGFCDKTLSSGSFSFSGNSLGIPKIELSVPEYFIIPGLGQLFAFKGSFAHGWIGDVEMKSLDEVDTVGINTYFHQKSFYGRFGKPSWKLKLYGGFNHQAFWGNERSFFGDIFTLTPFESYLYVISGTPYGNSDILKSKVGNHLGSIDLGLEYEFKNIKFLIYRQNVYEAGALYYLANIQDGLNGFSLENNQSSNKIFKWKKLLFEFLYTKNQAGEPWSPPTPSPFEGYYNHYQYIQGWSYNGVGMGTPFISQRNQVRQELPSHPSEYFINNRVAAFHFGFEGSVQNLNYIIKCSMSKNYGTYRTTDEEQSTGLTNPGAYGIFGKKEQFSAYLKFNRELTNGLNLGCVSAFDFGELYYNSFGILFSISKAF